MLSILTARARSAQFAGRGSIRIRLVGAAFLFVFGIALAAPVIAQERFSLFVPTVQDDVVRMIKLAGVRDGDMVFDLGSGDGRIVLEAARVNQKVRGRGIEINLKLVEARPYPSGVVLMHYTVEHPE